MTWILNGEPFDGIDIDNYEGFVYLITNMTNGKMYIGKKSFWSRRKPKRGGRRVTSESNWRDYYSSSDNLLADVEKLGKQAFKREILKLCRYKKGLSFNEQKEQWDRGVLLSDQYYNTNIGGKFFITETEKIYERHFVITTKNDKWRKIKSQQMTGDANIAKRPDIRLKISKKNRGANNAMYGKSGSLSPRWGVKHTQGFTEKVSGQKHWTFNGTYITPWGEYSSAWQAALKCPYNIGHIAIRRWCTTPNLRLSGMKKWSCFTHEDVGKTFKELGFEYRPIDND